MELSDAVQSQSSTGSLVLKVDPKIHGAEMFYFTSLDLAYADLREENRWTPNKKELMSNGPNSHIMERKLFKETSSLITNQAEVKRIREQERLDLLFGPLAQLLVKKLVYAFVANAQVSYLNKMKIDTNVRIICTPTDTLIFGATISNINTFLDEKDKENEKLKERGVSPLLAKHPKKELSPIGRADQRSGVYQKKQPQNTNSTETSENTQRGRQLDRSNVPDKRDTSPFSVDLAKSQKIQSKIEVAMKSQEFIIMQLLINFIITSS
jgi:hypothetical protein